MLNQIILQLLMSSSIANLMMQLEKILKCLQIVLSKLYRIIHILKIQTIVNSITLMIHNHVVHYHTSYHHLPRYLWIP